MDPLITDGIDPGLLRVIDRRGQERDRELRRRRAPASEPSVQQPKAQTENEETEADAPQHELDDLA